MGVSDLSHLILRKLKIGQLSYENLMKSINFAVFKKFVCKILNIYQTPCKIVYDCVNDDVYESNCVHVSV